MADNNELLEGEARRELEQHFGVEGAKAHDELDPVVPGRKGRVMAACACILGNEVCERLAYYGIQTNMGLYLKNYAGYPADKASQLLQVWKATVYLTPLLGAFLADAYMGRFWVILVFSIIYFIGMGGVTAVNLIPKLEPRYKRPPMSGEYGPSRAMLWAFMYLVALGSGGIKPCVSSFGGDQFRDGSKRERGWRSSFFNWLYFSINIGSLVATLVVVPVQETKGYGIGFGIPTIAMFVSILLFVAGALVKLYTIVPPAGSPFTRIFHVLRGAFVNRGKPAPSPSELYEPAAGEKAAVGFKLPRTRRMPCLDRAAIRHSGAAAGRYQPSVTEVEETKAFLGILPIFLCVCIYQMCYDPIFSLLPYPGDVMDRRIGNSGARIPASSISFANTFGVLLTIPLYDLVIVPFAIKLGRPITMIGRIGAGFVVCLLALLSAGFIELARYRTLRTSGLIDRWTAAVAKDPSVSYTDPAFEQPMSIWWQFIPYYLLGMSEVFANVGVMELFFTQMSEGMRAISASFYLLSVAIGTYLASALNIIVAAASPKDLWVADNPIYGHYDWYFFLNAGIVTAGLLAFVAVTWKFEERPIAPSGEHDPFNQQTRSAAELANVLRAWPSIRDTSTRGEELRARSSAVLRRRSTMEERAAAAAATKLGAATGA